MAELTRLGQGQTSQPRPALRERVQLSGEIASYIRELIISGQLRSDQTLSIDALARELQTSTTPVREALLVLRGEGFVQMEPRRGFRVAPLTRQDIEDMFFVQSIIAGELAARAAPLATEAFLTELNGLQERMRQADERSDQEEIELLNHEFHRLINLTTSAPKLTWLLSVVVRYVPRVFFSRIAGWHQASLGDHEAIIEALRNKDAAGVREAMTKHITHAGELLVAHLEKQGVWANEEEAKAT